MAHSGEVLVLLQDIGKVFSEPNGIMSLMRTGAHEETVAAYFFVALQAVKVIQEIVNAAN